MKVFLVLTFQAPLKPNENGLSRLFLSAFFPVEKVTLSSNLPVVRVPMHVLSLLGL